MTDAEQNRLIIDNYDLIAKVAAGFRGRGVGYEELLAIGGEGLTMAARDYQPVPSAKFSTYAVTRIKSHISNEVKSGRHQSVSDRMALEWGDVHNEQVHDWTAWGNGGNALAIYEIWSESFDASPEALSIAFDDIRDKRERFDAAFISLKPHERKLVTLVYLRDPPLSIERSARELRISYKKAWRTLERALGKMREVISAMEKNKKPLLVA